MDLLNIALFLAIVWVSLVGLAMAICRAAAQSDRASERFTASLQ